LLAYLKEAFGNRRVPAVIDPNKLLEQFLGKGAAASGGLGGILGKGSDMLAKSGGGDLLAKGKQMAGGKAGTLAVGAAAGGLLTMLLGSKKMRKFGGKALGYGGMAVLGGLAYKAWQDYQRNQAGGGAPATGGPAADKLLAPPADSPFNLESAPAADGADFRLAIVRAMIAAAKADGHVDAAEQQSLFSRVDDLGLGAEEKAFIFDELRKPLDIDAIAGLAKTEAQATELWLASRLSIDPDDAREKAYLDALAAKLKLQPALVTQLDAQARAAIAA
jgi:uncharacterized membrane protein YebE (DUF533 family)